VRWAGEATELEKRLKALGWTPLGVQSGANHDGWVHPTKKGRLYIRRTDVINVHTANRILEDAER
jgi:hypothetical protein